MVRRELPPTSRIFVKKRSWPARLVGAALLGSAAAAAGLGLGAGLYLDPGSAPAPAPIASAASPDTPIEAPLPEARDPRRTAAARLKPAVAPPPLPAPALPALEPQSGPSTPPAPTAPAPAVAALPPPEAPAAAPAPPPSPAPRAAATRAAPGYWVEYGVFAGEHYARRLQQSLSAQGIRSIITRTHTPAGRPLWRVRSAGLSDLGAARAAAGAARQSLKLASLIHRHAPARAPKAERYWVEFGRFPARPEARRMQQKLAQHGIATTVTSMRDKSGKPLFSVRSSHLASRAGAGKLVRQARGVLEARIVIGHDRASHRPHQPRPPPGHHVAQLR
jgi:cell division septation protein DedD